MRVHATKLGAISSGRGLGDQLYDLAGEVPPLDLNFADTKTLDPRITFTRASSGTFVSDGLIKMATTNEPRFDHNPTTGESLGLLVEEARTNLVANSADFSTFWTQTRLTVANNQIAAPDGTVTADLLTEDTTASASHTLQGSFSVTAGLNYTFSVWAKQNTSVATTRNIRIAFTAGQFGSAVSASFDLSTGTITTFNSPVATSYEAYPNGWAKVSVTALCLTTGAASTLNVQIAAGTTSQYTGNGASGNYVWGAQLEVGFPTSYIPTTGATATRAADVASITGANFSSWYNQAGTVFAEYRTPASGTRGVAGFNDNTANERIELFTSGTDPKMLLVDVGTTQADLDGGTIVASTMTKTAMAYAVNDFSIVHAAGTAVTDTNGTLPTVNRLLIGADQAGNYQNGRTKRLTYWPTRLADTTLQQITQP